MADTTATPSWYTSTIPQPDATAPPVAAQAPAPQSQAPQEVTIPMLGPDGSVADIPKSGISAAKTSGYKIAIDMTAPDGSIATIPYDNVSKAMSEGGYKLPGNDISNPEFSWAKQIGDIFSTKTLKGFYDMGIKPVRTLASQGYTDASDEVDGMLGSQTPEQKQAEADSFAAQEQHKSDVYHNASAQFHKAMANNDVGGVIDSGWSLRKLFERSDSKEKPNDVFLTLTDAALRGAEQQYEQAGVHATNVVTSIKEAANRHAAGDTEGAKQALINAQSEGLQTIGHGLATALPLLGPAAAKAGEDIGKGDLAYGLGEAGALLGPTALKAARATGVVGKVAGAVGEAADRIKESPLGDNLPGNENGANAPVDTTPASTPIADSVNAAKQSASDMYTNATAKAADLLNKGKAAVPSVAAGVGKVAGQVAASGAWGFGAGVLDTVAGKITDALNSAIDATKNAVTPEAAVGSMQDLRANVRSALSTVKGLPPDAISDIVDQVVDEHYIKSHPVSGGAPEATADGADFSDESQSVKDRISGIVQGVADKYKDFKQAAVGSNPRETAVARAAAIDPSLSKVATPAQLGHSSPVIENALRKLEGGVGQHIAKVYDKPALDASVASAQKAVGEINPDTAALTQAQRAARVKGGIVSPETPTIDMSSPDGVMQATKALLSAEDYANGVGRVAHTPNEYVFNTLDAMSPRRFSDVMGKLGSEGADVVRQGLVQHMLEKSRDPETGLPNFKAFQKSVAGAGADKLGDQYSKLKTLSDGYAELEDWRAKTNVNGFSLLSKIGGGLAVGLIDVGLAGADPLRIAGLLGIEAGLYKYAGPAIADFFLKPRNVNDLNFIMKSLNNMPDESIQMLTRKVTAFTKRAKMEIVNNVVKAAKNSNTITDKAKDIYGQFWKNEDGFFRIPGTDTASITASEVSDLRSAGLTDDQIFKSKADDIEKYLQGINEARAKKQVLDQMNPIWKRVLGLDKTTPTSNPVHNSDGSTNFITFSEDGSPKIEVVNPTHKQQLDQLDNQVRKWKQDQLDKKSEDDPK